MEGEIPERKSKKPLVALPDTDSMECLSLSMIPLESSTLKNARLVKNDRLESELELHCDPVAGSLRIRPADIESQIGANEQDRRIVLGLARLGSYDVYTLKTSLKAMGVALADDDALELSEGMKAMLAQTTQRFTRPMIEKIFGGGSATGAEPDIWNKMFHDPDVAQVRRNLLKMQETTGIALEDIPKFLGEYSALFLSVAYYRYTFDALVPEIVRFKAWMKDLKNSREVCGSPRMSKTCQSVSDDINFLVASMQERVQRFQASFELFWSDIRADTFAVFQERILENQASMGELLCGLNIKIRAWQKEFPDNNVAGPATRAKYVMSVMESGLHRLRQEETHARARLGLLGGK